MGNVLKEMGHRGTTKNILIEFPFFFFVLNNTDTDISSALTCCRFMVCLKKKSEDVILVIVSFFKLHFTHFQSGEKQITY